MWTHRRVTVDAAGRRCGFMCHVYDPCPLCGLRSKMPDVHVCLGLVSGEAACSGDLKRRERVSLTSAPPLGEARPGASARRLSTVLASAPRAPRGWYTRLGTRSFSGDRGRLRFYKGPQFRGGAGGAPGIAGPTGKPSQRISWLGYLYGVGLRAWARRSSLRHGSWLMEHGVWAPSGPQKLFLLFFLFFFARGGFFIHISSEA